MKILYRQDGILDAEENYIIHGCNAQGAMGSGVAKVLFDRYPTVRTTYLAAHKKSVELGEKFLGTLHFVPNDPHNIINGITQEFYGRDGKLYASYEAIAEVFIELDEQADLINNHPEKMDGTILAGLPPMQAVAMPLLGCGLAGGSWTKVSEIIELTANHYQPIVYLNGEPIPVPEQLVPTGEQ